MAKVGIVREFLQFLWQKKLWWIAPIFIIIIIIVLVAVFYGNVASAPFIYAIF